MLNPSISNETLYFEKLVDELIRFNRIKKYIFDEKMFLTQENDSYNLKDNEILLFQSEITKEYFDDMTPAGSNKYVDSSTYENINPLYSGYYTKNVDELKKTTKIKTCEKNKIKLKKILSNVILGSNYYETSYVSNIKCSFEILLSILNKMGKSDMDINKLKKILYEQYSTVYNQYLNKIKDILLNEGKRFYIYQIYGKKLSLSDYIMSENYFLSFMDIWVLSKALNIPLLILSGGKIKANDKRYFITNSSSEDMYYIMKIVANAQKSYPEYRLITDKENNKIDITSMMLQDNITLKQLIEEQPTVDIKTYLSGYVIKKKKLVLVK